MGDQTLYKVKELRDEWAEGLLQIARGSPVETDGFRIFFDRSPDIFIIPKLTSYKYICGGIFRYGELQGYAIAAYQKRYVDQRLTDVMYLGNLHIAKSGRGKGFFYRMSDFFFGDLTPNIEYVYSYIMEQNQSAMDLVNRTHPNFPNVPYSGVIGRIAMVNIFLTIPVRRNRKYIIRKATPTDIDQIVRLLSAEYTARFLAPEMNHRVFLRYLSQRPHFGIENYFLALYGSEVIGVCSVWDMTPLKKNTILGYSNTMRKVRLLYNFGAPLFGIPGLPAPGDALRDVTIAEYAVKERDPDIMEDLLRYIYKQYRHQGYHSIIFGSSADDPLLKATKTFFKKSIYSNVILGSLQPEKLDEMKNKKLIYADAVQI